MNKRVTVNFFWASGKLVSFIIPTGIAANIYRALRDDRRIFDLKFDGLDYKHYIETYGGTVVDGVDAFVQRIRRRR